MIAHQEKLHLHFSRVTGVSDPNENYHCHCDSVCGLYSHASRCRSVCVCPIYYSTSLVIYPCVLVVTVVDCTQTLVSGSLHLHVSSPSIKRSHTPGLAGRKESLKLTLHRSQTEPYSLALVLASQFTLQSQSPSLLRFGAQSINIDRHLQWHSKKQKYYLISCQKMML